MDNGTYPPPLYHTGQFHLLKNPVFHLFIPSSSRTPPTTDPFTVSVVLPLLEGRIIGVIQEVAFSDWLLSQRRSMRVRILLGTEPASCMDVQHSSHTGPALVLTHCSCHLKTLITFKRGASALHFASGASNYVAALLGVFNCVI